MELILWGIPKAETDSLYAQVLYTQAKTEADIERIKALASKDGWHSFSVQRIDGTIPDFGKGIARQDVDTKSSVQRLTNVVGS